MDSTVNRDITYSSACGCSSFDGNFDTSKADHISEFQTYANSKGESLSVNGQWDAPTSKVYRKYKDGFLADNKASKAQILANQSVVDSGGSYTKGKRLKERSKEALGLFGKAKDFLSPSSTTSVATDSIKQPMSNTMKYSLIGLGVVIAGVAIYFVVRKK